MGRGCQNYGLLVDVMSIWAKEYNFTWDVYRDINNNWGLQPVSGKTESLGKTTDMVFVDIFNAA